MLTALLWNLLITAGLALVLTVLCRLPALHRRPALRCWLWLMLVAKLITPPLFDVPLFPAVASNNEAKISVESTAALPSPVNSTPVNSTPVNPTPPHELATLPNFQPDTVIEDPAASKLVEEPDLNSGEAAFSPAPSQKTQKPYLAGLLAVSLIGTFVLLITCMVRAVRLNRWLRRACTDDARLAQVCAEVAASLGIRRTVRTAVIDTRTTPLLWGCRTPMVVLPRPLLDDLGPESIRNIVAHELAHLLRRDTWANVFVFLVRSVMWWNPVAWWAERELRSAQELCCDAMVIDCCNASRRSYATTLLQALDFIQDEPISKTPHALASRMGSRRSILRRFEMIVEKPLSYQLSRRTLFGLLMLVVPMLCMPVRAQVEEPSTPVKVEAKEPTKVETLAASAMKTEMDATTKDKKEEKSEEKPTETNDASDTEPLDQEAEISGAAVFKRLTTYSDEAVLTLKDGQTSRMKVKKNLTPVAEIRITAHFVNDDAKLDLEGLDADGNVIEETKASSTQRKGYCSMMDLGNPFPVDGEKIVAMVKLTPTNWGNKAVTIKVQALFTRKFTVPELKAMQQYLKMGTDFGTISRWVKQYQQKTGHYPKSLQELGESLPKDVYSPTGEDYLYEAHSNRFILRSCGEDGIHGTEDDQEELRPLRIVATKATGKSVDYTVTAAITDGENISAQRETVHGERPRGNCSISGKVVSAETGEPIGHARVYLHYNVNHNSIFIDVASDGTFHFKDIPKGPFSLTTTYVAGYQDTPYNPEEKPGPYPPFSLKDGELRSGVVLKAKRSYCISGKVLDENGKVPKDANTIVLAWSSKENAQQYGLKQTGVNWEDGSYLIDGLDGKPTHVMVINWRAAKQGDAYPPVYYPGTFSRNEATRITFDKSRTVENIDITLKKEDGLILEGTVLDKDGKPVPEAFVVAHRPDMLFDLNTAYTDEQGKYQIKGMGDGKFVVHVDAVHRGWTRTRSPIEIDRGKKSAKLDFTLTKGATISGKLVDEEGKDWTIERSSGFTSAEKSSESLDLGFSLGGFRNKHRPQDSGTGSGGNFALGTGNYNVSQMLFPTKNTFLVQGMMPGDTKIHFLPKKEGQKVVKILYQGKDILESGIKTEPGQDIEGVTIVIGK